jgi:hypothetical protein
MHRPGRASEASDVVAGTTILLSYAVLIPGVFPALALLGLITAVVLAPVLVLGLVLALLALLPLALWRLLTRGRRRRAAL